MIESKNDVDAGIASARLHDALTLSERLSSVTSIAASGEYLYNLARNRRDLGEVDEIDPESPEASTREARVLSFLARRPIRVAAYTLRGAAGLALLVLPARFGATRGVASLVSAAIGAAYAPLQRFGSDGADQATVLAQASNAVARLGTPDVRKFALVFQAAQLSMSYGVAGWAKILGAPWRDGTAVRDIVRTKSYGHQALWRHLHSHPALSRALTWAVVVWESAFPAIIFMPRTAAKGMAVAGLFFHIANGAAMGLWRFIFAFASLHPALHRVIDRDAPISAVRQLTAVSCAIFGLAWVRSASEGRRVSAEVRDIYMGTDRVISRRGTSIPVDISLGDDDAPIAILEGGLLSMSEQFHWLSQALGQKGWTTVRTTRAIYADVDINRLASRFSDSDQHLEMSAQDLADVASYAERRWPGRRIYLIGHSLGAEFVRRAAPQHPQAMIVLIDPTHPNQFVESHLQADGRKGFSEQIKLFQVLLNLGFGSFLTKPESMASLPKEISSTAMMKYRDAHLWNAGAGEWAAVVASFDQSREVERPTNATLAISAGRTIESDPTLHRLHGELSSEAHEVIEDVTHESLIANSAHARLCAEIILQWSEAGHV